MDVFEWKVNGVKPERFKGSSHKWSWRMWKKKVEKIELLKKDQGGDLTQDNVFVTMLHQGYASLRRRMCRVYFIPNFEGWVKEKLQDCNICSLVRRKDIIPPTGAIVPSKPKKSWQMDFIGKFKIDARYGHR